MIGPDLESKMARKKQVQPIHPLKMAAALELINDKAGALIARVNTIHDLAEHLDPAALRKAIAEANDAANDFRETLWPQAD